MTLGLYLTNQCAPLNIDKLTEEEAQGVCAQLHRVFKAFLPLWELEVVSNRLANILRINHIPTLAEIAKIHPWKWKRMHKMGRTSYEELRIIVGRHGIPLQPWEEIKLA
jgi:hypothetical protein